MKEERTQAGKPGKETKRAKRTLRAAAALLLTFVLLFSLTACGSSDAGVKTESQAPQTTEEQNNSNQADTNSNAAETKETETKPAEEKPKETVYTIDNEVIVDNDYCTVTLINGTAKKNGGADFKFALENKTDDKNLMFSMDDTAVNGWVISSLFAETVAAGKKSNETLSLSGSDLQDCNLTSVDKLAFYLRVYDDDDWMADEFVEETFTVYPTGLTEAEVISPERPQGKDEMTVVDNDTCEFVILGTYEDSIWGYTAVVYLENKTTDSNIMFSWDDVSVNGYMIDPFWARSVPAGDKRLSTISFSSSDLEENDIESVEEIELRVYDEGNWSEDDFVKDTFTYTPAQ